MTSRKTLVMALVVFGGLGAVCPAPGAVTIQDFVLQKKRWTKQVGQRQVIEGRWAVTGRTLLKFQGCALEFRSREPLPKLVHRSARDVNVQVIGRLRPNAGKLYFQIEQIAKLPDDLTVYRRRRPTSLKATAEDWYALGRWAARRGAFYKDAELTAKATEANTMGIGLARRKAAGDAEALGKLAETAVTLRVAAGLPMAIAHQALVVQRKASRGDLGKMKAVRDQVGRMLPGARDPKNQPTAALARRYRAENPVSVYDGAGQEDRRRLHRVFYVDLATEVIVAGARPDGSNGYEIAQAIRKVVPENTTEADRWERLALRRDLERVPRMNRLELEQVVERLRMAKRLVDAQRAVDRWLEQRRRRLMGEGVSGRLQLADLLLSLRNDREQAMLVLQDADRLKPGDADVAEAMQRLGYVKQGDRWVIAEGKAQPKRPRAGWGLRIGMTRKNLLAAMGVPRRISRVASAGAISEIWVYGDPRSGRIAVHLLRSHAGSAAVVRDFCDLPSRR